MPSRSARKVRSDAFPRGPHVNDAIRLACLVLAANASRRAAIADLLGGDARVVLVDELADPENLPASLLRHRHDLVVFAPQPDDATLPWPLGRPAERAPIVLVFPPLGQDAGSWLARGADDVVGLTYPETMRHAVRRVLDERAGHARVRATLRRLGDERALSDVLFEAHPRALVLLRGNEPLRGNRRFDALVGATGKRGRGMRWRGWLDAVSMHALDELPGNRSAEVVLGTRQGARHAAVVEPLAPERDGVRLIAIDTLALAPLASDGPTMDPATGLLVRDALVERFEAMLVNARESSRYTAMRVLLPGTLEERPADGVGRAYEDLLVLRAAEALRGRFQGETLLGRAGRSALLVVRPGHRGEASRDLAAQVRETLGSLGGFIERPSAVRIHTLTLPAKAMSARAVVERLEAR